MLNERNQIPSTQFYAVSTFVMPFYYGSRNVIYYGSGSAMAKSYGSYGSGFSSATLASGPSLRQSNS
jgi:hypothetical protein